MKPTTQPIDTPINLSNKELEPIEPANPTKTKDKTLG